MPKSNAFWGIDIGQCALKALRCMPTDDEQVLEADAFDFIEYPKLLSQPDADREELISEALETFLSRNEVKGDGVAISVSGQSGLARFFKPPPVDAKTIPDIVKYEARQQIPFELEDVIWDFQQMAGGQIVDGLALDAEIGLFAMKREQVYKALQPFLKRDVEVDLIQLAPLSIYNFVAHDVMTDLPDPDLYDPGDPPESLVVLSMGVETTDLVITNGFRVWQRSIPLGGNHFTKQLTKEMKLTFAKAEHVKRNARQAEDPKALFQAMRPVFNDLVGEVQRSVGFFQNIDRQAKIGKVVMLGNASKLPGLREYLAKNLGQEIIRVKSFRKLTGDNVVSSKSFTDNVLSFGVCYGLCLQGAKAAKLSTNLLPQEFHTERLIRDKKPWAVASVAALLLAYTLYYVFTQNAAASARLDRVDTTASGQTVTYQKAIAEVNAQDRQSQQYKGDDSTKEAKRKYVLEIGKEVVGNADRRLLWLEMLKAINQVLPQTPGKPSADYIPLPQERPLKKRRELYIDYVESEFFSDLKEWYAQPVRDRYEREIREAELLAQKASGQSSSAAGQAGDATPGGAAPNSGGDAGPSGPGWVIELSGYHLHNEDRSNQGITYLRNTLLRNLRESTVKLPEGPGKRPLEFTMKELGIGYPIIVSFSNIYPVQEKNPNFEGMLIGQQEGGGGGGMMGGMMGGAAGRGAANQPSADEKQPEEDPNNKPTYDAERFDFTVQFCWTETLLSDRLEAKRKEAAEKAAQAQAELAAQQAAQEGPPGANPAPAGTNPAPAGANPAPAGANPAPAGTNPAPAGTNPAPAGTNPAPAGTNPAPAGTNPAPPGANAGRAGNAGAPVGNPAGRGNPM